MINIVNYSNTTSLESQNVSHLQGNCHKLSLQYTSHWRSFLLQNVNEDNTIVIQGSGIGGTPTALRIPKERMATMLLTSPGGKSGTPLSYPTLRLVTGGPGGLKQALKLTSNSSSEGCGSRFGQRQDPFLLMSSDTIPTLLELTQQDYDVNAPSNNSLLQGAELLMALDQSSEAALLDGK